MGPSGGKRPEWKLFDKINKILRSLPCNDASLIHESMEPIIYQQRCQPGTSTTTISSEDESGSQYDINVLQNVLDTNFQSESSKASTSSSIPSCATATHIATRKKRSRKYKPYEEIDRELLNEIKSSNVNRYVTIIVRNKWYKDTLNDKEQRTDCYVVKVKVNHLKSEIGPFLFCWTFKLLGYNLHLHVLGLVERLNVLYEKNWTRLVTEQLKRFEKAVIESSRTEGISNISCTQWTFGGALLYSLTLLTTVGYGRLSPRTSLGKAAAMIYAIVGVPLMLVLLSALGSLLAGCAKKAYIKLCCKHEDSKKAVPTVEYHRAPSSPSVKPSYRLKHEDTSSVQLMPTHCMQNNVNHKLLHQPFDQGDPQDIPKRAMLATVRATHTRGRCAQGQVRQMLADPLMCPSHTHCSPSRSIPGCTISMSDLEETDENEEHDSGICTHDTPSRMPLIWRSPEQLQGSTTPLPTEPPPSVPAVLVILIFIAYVCLGAVAFSSTSGWSFLDAVYFCFIALSTIGIGDKLPQSADYYTQLQLLACCVYLFIGLIIVAMCFSLVHEEIATKCKQFAISMGLVKH
ncbi:hypothetical protein FQA39_LY00155 [Lamprigera yunnana]|nr:hypothetical protein FQA39_LY00155 [Lamprigera yunnana]